MEKSNNIFNEVNDMVIAIIGENSALGIHFNYLEVDNEYEGKQTIKSLYTNSGNVYYNYTDYPGVQCLGALTDASLRKIKEVIRDNAFWLQDRHGCRYKAIAA